MEPEAGPEQIERHTWRLASALTRRWPNGLGYVVHTHPMDFYDLISLRPPQSPLIGPPWPQAHVTLNRPGSLRVITATGAERWRWSGIWEHLAKGGDVEEAAALVGAVAALPAREPSSGATFAQLADQVLDLTASADWTWQCAWQDGWVPDWIERYGPVLRQYTRRPGKGRLPSLSRIWGAVRHDAAAVLIDQTNLRAWIWDGSPRLLQGRIDADLAAIVGAVDG